mgnify:CR=1 FL=1
MLAVREFVKNVLMKMAYEVADKKNSKKYMNISPRSLLLKSEAPTNVRSRLRGRYKHMKLNHHDTQRASLRRAIIIIPSLSLFSFSRTKLEIVLLTGYSSTMISHRAKTNPIAAQKPVVS